MLHISTPYGDEYTINGEGDFYQYNQHYFDKENRASHEWKFIGLMPVHCWQSYHLIPFKQINKDWLQSHPLRFKNGHPRYTVMDLDHGTYRLWGNTTVHGVGSIWFDG